MSSDPKLFQDVQQDLHRSRYYSKRERVKAAKELELKAARAFHLNTLANKFTERCFRKCFLNNKVERIKPFHESCLQNCAFVHFHTRNIVTTEGYERDKDKPYMQGVDFDKLRDIDEYLNKLVLSRSNK